MTIPQKVSEVYAFTMAPELLYSVISSQAGTPAKALLEGLMNSIDAGASKVFITVDETGFTVVDDGKGFESKQTIIDFFGTFGKKHEEGDAVYGKYRMGRGQMMSFGHNTWRSGDFIMEVDIKNKGLDYNLSEVAKGESLNGCEIKATWYDKMLPSGIDAVTREFKEMAAYAQIPVIYNGKQCNKIPSNETWDLETEDAYFKFRETTGLTVYNLGVLVKTYPNYQFGMGGVVVSKHQLQVNFARNDILLSKCGVWKRLSKHLKSISVNKIEKKAARITEDERIAMTRMLLAGEISPIEFISRQKVITNAKGAHSTLDALMRLNHSTGNIITFCNNGCQIGEMMHKRGIAFVISKVTLARFDADTPEEFFDAIDRVVELMIDNLLKDQALRGKVGRNDFSYHRKSAEELRKSYRPMDDLREDTMGTHVVLDAKELNARQKLILKVLSDTSRLVSNLPYIRSLGASKRKLLVGRSDVSEAWTDGGSYIVLNETIISGVSSNGYHGMMRAVGILVHEYLHNDSDKGSHVHDLDFYEAWHETVLDEQKGFSVGAIIDYSMLQIAKEYKEMDKRAPAGIVKALDVMAVTNTTPTQELKAA